MCQVSPFDITDMDYPPGTTITINCPEGFEFVGEKTQLQSQCKNDGSWSIKSIGSCKPKSQVHTCGEPPVVGNADIIERHIAQAHERHRRHVESYFAPTLPPPKVYHVVNVHGVTGPVYPTRTRYPVGSSIRYACKPGYRIRGDDRIFCHDPNWTTAPRCIRTCHAPAMGPFVVIDRQLTSEYGFDFFVDGFIQFKCIDDDAYEMYGSSKITCLSSGHWSARVPICRPKGPPTIAIVECNTPELPSNAKIAAQVVGERVGKHPVNGYIRYTCEDGYEMGPHQRPIITCQSDGTWDYPVPRCKPIYRTTERPYQCVAPEVPANGIVLRHYTSNVVSSMYPVGGYIEYGCQGGCELIGERKLTCTFSGWSSEPPTCQMTCPEPVLSIGSGNVQLKYQPHERTPAGRYPQGSSYVFQCADGHQLVNGSLVMICAAHGHWEPHHLQPVCRRIGTAYRASSSDSSCGSPPLLANGTIIGKSTPDTSFRYQVGSRAIYKCMENYNLVGSDTYICKDDGFWFPLDSEMESYCEITCPAPIQPEFSRTIDMSKYVITMNRYSRGAFIRYQCKEGAKMIGDSSIWCHENGNWSKQPPVCQVPCVEPPLPSHAKVVNQSAPIDVRYDDYGFSLDGVHRFTPGSFFKYDCVDGYNFQDDSLNTIICHNGGQWRLPNGKELTDICFFFPNWMAQK